LQLGDIISIAQSGQHIPLGRGSGDALVQIKEVGDAAAHNRTYITKQKDIDDICIKLRCVVSELQHLAGIEPSKSSDAE